jgi:hypothetical protein
MEVIQRASGARMSRCEKGEERAEWDETTTRETM